ncbi:hypothetical protein [Ulvibacterium sp.]|uniref:hypothetical protein n=1 Tax=Ulvibacterium sp. TaxID=2665914 RepID=UPI003BA9A1DA
MKKFYKWFFIFSISCLWFSCSEKIDETFFFGPRKDFTISNDNILVYEDVEIELNGELNFNNGDFILVKPDLSEEEIGSRFIRELKQVGEFTIYQNGYRDNSVKITVNPNLIFWTNRPGNPINIEVSSFDSSFGEPFEVLSETIACIRETIPVCKENIDTNCKGFAVSPSATAITFNAEDGVYMWSATGFESLDAPPRGECLIIRLNRP